MTETRVREIMIPGTKALFATEDEPVEKAINEFLSQPELHTLFIVDKHNKYKGAVKLHYILNWVKLKLGMEIVNRSSIRTADSLHAFEVVKLCQSQTIGDILSAAPEVKPDATLAEALRIMVLEQAIELPVVDNNGMFLGEIKLPQLLSKMLGDNKATGPVCETKA
ncbi:CBS domain-containing protein [Dehalogenimonas etheniformans]|uniref:CBS domain-containing protein n=1 Tax=Dehalogenimonas etheniformans TaxID=1536648 RepID=A0A2P5P8I4_9CHLR|nr:CBS domain-containing protein [Dehalogenimonas etheniformans]PPD58601.1 CBS domain-containing protein [Dehalogenimonas etheniformans]QNT76632.1 CBS domain-containing protein [Dehalogenimonas etheniformans]